MKAKRRIDTQDLAARGLDTSAPPSDSLFFTLWRAATPIAEATLQLPYLKGIAAGTLDPTEYGAYNVADAYYCFHGADDYANAAARAPEGSTLRHFLDKKHRSYHAYNASFPSTWNLESASGIVPPQAVEVYVEFESVVTTRLDPGYCVVAMLPCEYLWYWLAHAMAPAKAGNLYGSWITGNDDPKGAYAMGNFLDQYQADHPAQLRTDEATWLYGFASYCEYANFAAGTRTTPSSPSSFGLRAPAWSGAGWDELAALYRKLESLASAAR